MGRWLIQPADADANRRHIAEPAKAPNASPPHILSKLVEARARAHAGDRRAAGLLFGKARPSDDEPDWIDFHVHAFLPAFDQPAAGEGHP
ncbi:hypothetical protein SMC26_18665 [Actinomadura fulvescens]|uniref:hypothetical protein n=1 Tax=Actinomadura fulvescens TaxID=46160 RepID=UPI0031DA19CD